MTTLRQAAQQALAALQNCANGEDDVLLTRDALADLRAALEQQAEPVAQRRPFDILVITTAYEQGVGKGHQAHGRSVEIENPYAPGECHQAWALGYDEGKEQVASKAAHGIKENT